MTNATEHRKDRIKYLRKQEAHKHRLPEFLNSLTAIAGYPITIDDVVSIEDANEVWRKIYTNEKFHQANFSVSFPHSDKNKLDKIFEVLRTLLIGQKQYFTTDKFRETCLLLIDTSFCVSEYQKLIELDGDTFYIYDEDINNSLWIDTNEDPWRGKEEYAWTYEVRVSGMDWMEKIFEAYKEVRT